MVLLMRFISRFVENSKTAKELRKTSAASFTRAGGGLSNGAFHDVSKLRTRCNSILQTVNHHAKEEGQFCHVGDESNPKFQTDRFANSFFSVGPCGILID